MEHFASVEDDRRRQGGNLRRRSSRAAPPCSTATTRISSGSPAAARDGGIRPHHRLRPARRCRCPAARGCGGRPGLADRGGCARTRLVDYPRRRPRRPLGDEQPVRAGARRGALGADVGAAAAALADLRPPKGRGQRTPVRLARRQLRADRRQLQRQPAVDARRPSQVLGRSRPGSGGRRIAVLGDMLELGADAPALHAGLAAPAASTTGIDLVFTAGPMMAHLHEALPRGDARRPCGEFRGAGAAGRGGGARGRRRRGQGLGRQPHGPRRRGAAGAGRAAATPSRPQAGAPASGG